LISSSITSTVVSARFWYLAIASSSFWVNSLACMAFFWPRDFTWSAISRSSNSAARFLVGID
jgi:hypothetical protein